MALETKASKRRFVRELTRSVARSVIEKIDSGAIPANWDGHELRELMAVKFLSERTRTMSIGRKREFTRVVITNNL